MRIRIVKVMLISTALSTPALVLLPAKYMVEGCASWFAPCPHVTVIAKDTIAEHRELAPDAPSQHYCLVVEDERLRFRVQCSKQAWEATTVGDSIKLVRETEPSGVIVTRVHGDQHFNRATK